MALVFLLFLFALPYLSQQQIIRLIHRDSPDSPLFCSTVATADKWLRAHQRSVAYRDLFRAAVEGRCNSLMPLLAAAKDQEAGFDQVGGEYLMQLAIGTPPVPVTAMVDVPGDFIWTQCVPCSNCSPHLGRLYDPSRSSTHTTYSCSSTTCNNLNSQCGANDTCEYIRFYGNNNSQTTGVLTSDVFTLVGVAYDDMAFGCGSDNSFSTEKATARVGLLGSVFALLFNFNLGYRVPPTLSHCFAMDWDNSGKTSSNLNLGKDAKLNGPFSTPLATCPVSKFSNFFSPNLLDINVRPERLNLTTDMSGGNCSTVFASSTPLTFLKTPVFDLLASKVKQYAHLPVALPRPGDPWDLCFKGTIADVIANKLLPLVDLHFPQLTLSLDEHQLYAEVDDGRVCLLMAPTDSVNMIGTYAQTNRHIAYDLNSPNERLILGSSGCNA